MSSRPRPRLLSSHGFALLVSTAVAMAMGAVLGTALAAGARLRQAEEAGRRPWPCDCGAAAPLWRAGPAAKEKSIAFD